MDKSPPDVYSIAVMTQSLVTQQPDLHHHQMSAMP
jgi:hypothetical protein